MSLALLVSVFVISTCGLVYELISGALASYLLGDSITQFSTVIGVYLFSMGIGSFLSKYVERNLVSVFVRVELIVGLVGGLSAPVLFALFEHVSSFRVVLYSSIFLTGVFVGLEIPLLMRILRDRFTFKDLVSRVFTFDYIGALIISVLFPLVLVPYLGLVRSSLLFGMLNIGVAFWAMWLFRREVGSVRSLALVGGLILLVLAGGFASAGDIMAFGERDGYQGKIIFSKSTPYQRVILTIAPHDLRLYLNGNLQFSSRDEYRYHEALVHFGLAAIKNPRDVLILGGGDGLAAREVLRYPSIRSITLVDLDPEVTSLFANNPALAELNGGALKSPKLKIINEDAFVWIKNQNRVYDYVIADFPDPSNYSVGKLFSTAFYKELYRVVAPDGGAVIQSTSPLVARKTYWCVDHTLDQAGFFTTPYHAYVPSFGEWGFILATKRPFAPAKAYPPGLKFINPEVAHDMLIWPSDMGQVATEVNRLNNQILVRYFEDEWFEYLH